MERSAQDEKWGIQNHPNGYQVITCRLISKHKLPNADVANIVPEATSTGSPYCLKKLLRHLPLEMT
jgi:hypothetical protein